LPKHALKLRIYPNKAQEAIVFRYALARQYAYHLGIQLNHDEYALRKEMLQAFPMHAKEILYPKWKTKGFLSKLISQQKQEVKLYNDTHEDHHPLSFLNEVPRCILTQGLEDYQKCLNKAFDDIKKGLPKKLRTGFPRFYSLYKKQTFRYQIDQPATNQKHLDTWKNNKIRCGDVVLRYKDPTALPQKLPSLVTISKNTYGQYFASFLTDEPRAYKNPLHQEKLLLRKQKQKALALLGQTQARQIGYDPNMQAEYFYDSTGLSFSIAERDDKKLLEMKLLKTARYLNKTRQRNKKKGIPASKRSLKAKQRLNKIYNDRKNQKKDFQAKKVHVMASLYPFQSREMLNVKEMMEKSGKTQSQLRKDRDYKKYHLARSFGYVAMASQRTLMEEKLNKIHGEKSSLVTLPEFERTTQCCSVCGEERFVVRLGVKVWQCPYCETIHIRDECAAQNTFHKGFDEQKLSKNKSFLLNHLHLSFPNLEIDPKRGWPVARSVGLDAGKRHRFVKLNQTKQEWGKFETQLFTYLETFAKVKVSVPKEPSLFPLAFQDKALALFNE
jgi:putative transposase